MPAATLASKLAAFMAMTVAGLRSVRADTAVRAARRAGPGYRPLVTPAVTLRGMDIDLNMSVGALRDDERDGDSVRRVEFAWPAQPGGRHVLTVPQDPDAPPPSRWALIQSLAEAIKMASYGIAMLQMHTEDPGVEDFASKRATALAVGDKVGSYALLGQKAIGRVCENPGCNNLLSSARPEARYCSARCRVAGHRARIAAAIAP
jgi:hypothetical protein